MANFRRAIQWTRQTFDPVQLNAEFDNIVNNVTDGGINSENLDLAGTYTWTGAHTFPSGVALDLATEDVTFVDAGSASATEQDWIEVTVGGATGYLRVYATK